jgi:hypothetical protein
MTNDELVDRARAILFPNDDTTHECGAEELGQLVNLLMPADLSAQRIGSLIKTMEQATDDVHEMVERIRCVQDNSSCCGEYTDEQTETLACAATEIANSWQLNNILVQLPRALAHIVELNNENDRLRTGNAIEGDYVMSTEPHPDETVNVTLTDEGNKVAILYALGKGADVLPNAAWWSRFDHVPEAVRIGVIPCALKVTALQALPHGDTRVHVALPAALGGGLGSLPIKHVQCALLYPVRSVTVPSHRGASYVNVNLDDGRVLRAYATEERARQAALTAGHLFGWCMHIMPGHERFRWCVGTKSDLQCAGVTAALGAMPPGMYEAER